MTPPRLSFYFAVFAAFQVQGGALRAQEAPRAIPVSPLGIAQPGVSETGLSQTGTLAPMSPVDRNQKLGIGDQVSLQILEDRTPPMAARVSDTGDLEVPYVGRIRAEGRTVAALSQDIERALEKDFYYKATVRLAIDQVNREATRSRVFLSGEIKSPGAQDFYRADNLTVGGAVLRAGSFTQWANKRDVRVVRSDGHGGNQTYKVDLKSVLEDGQVENDMVLKDGDYIIVRKRLINF